MNNRIKKITDDILTESSYNLSYCPSINICGREIEIENYKKIYKLTSDEIIILFTRKCDDVKITGKNLYVKRASDCSLIIKGEIERIIYQNRCDKRGCNECY